MCVKYIKLAIILFLIISVVLFSRFSGIENYINFQILKDNRAHLLAIVEHNYWSSVFVYIITYIFVVALSLPVAVPLTLIGGFVFGVLPAVLYINIGATLGAVVTFLIVRYLLGFELQKTYSQNLIEFNRNIALYGANYLLLARFIVLIPFFLINILAGLTNIPLKTFIWTTSLGIIPGSLIYAYAGKNIISINAPHEIFSLKIIAIFLVIITFGIFLLLFKKLKVFKNIKVSK
jgi:uncharacterized membrane protein YdjX (TVP38/TMEM64 family)